MKRSENDQIEIDTLRHGLYLKDRFIDNQYAHIADLELRITALQAKLEVHPHTNYDGIDCRDVTIQELERQNVIEHAKSRHWKANHDTMVTRAAFLSQRPDLPVDRIPAYQELEQLRARIAELEADMLECQQSNRQAWGIANAVAAALGDDLDTDIGSAESIDLLKTRVLQAEAQIAAQAGQVLYAGHMPVEKEEMQAAAYGLAPWLAAALDDPAVCAEYKAAINGWFDTAMPQAPAQAGQSGYQLMPVHLDDSMLRYAMECTKQIGSDAAQRIKSTYYFLLEAARTSAPPAPANPLDIVGAALEAAAKILDAMVAQAEEDMEPSPRVDYYASKAAEIRAIDKQTVLDGVGK